MEKVVAIQLRIQLGSIHYTAAKNSRKSANAVTTDTHKLAQDAIGMLLVNRRMKRHILGLYKMTSNSEELSL